MPPEAFAEVVPVIRDAAPLPRPDPVKRVRSPLADAPVPVRIETFAPLVKDCELLPPVTEISPPTAPLPLERLMDPAFFLASPDAMDKEPVAPVPAEPDAITTAPD
jgi:hypothetical protein